MRAYKTEIKPTEEQIRLLHQTFGNTRFIYNAYLAYNFDRYEQGEDFVSGMTYSKMINNNPETPAWLKTVSSKAIKQAIMYAEKAFKDYFKGRKGKPHFKKKTTFNSFYLIGTIKVERHRIFLPTLKWVRLKEYGYIPDKVKSVTVSMKNGRYYVSCLVDEDLNEKVVTSDEGVGIDFGLKDQFITDTKTYPSVNKLPRVRKLEKKLKREQGKLSRKYEANMTSKVYSGGRLKSFKWVKPLKDCKNIQKQKLKVNKLHEKLTRVRTSYIHNCIQDILNQKPRFITIEDLNIKNMMKNKHLARYISGAKWYESRIFLKKQCKKMGIELRAVSPFYPSSKLCSSCGFKNKNLKLKDRSWKCTSCGISHNRDANASLNLKQSEEYTVLVPV